MTWTRSGALLAGCVGAMAVCARLPDTGVGYRLGFVLAALGACGAAWRVAQAPDLRLRHVLALGVGLRLLLLPLLPTLSDDGFRYVWDGMLLAQHGINPYAFVPSAPELSAFHAEKVFEGMNSPNYYSVYPPVSQAIFALGGAVYGYGWMASWYVIKGILVGLECIGIACLTRVVDVRGVALYVLHPIAILEIAGQGHTEGALVGALGLALLLAYKRSMWVGAALAIAGWVKLSPFGLAATLGTRWRAWALWGVVMAGGMLWLVPDSGLRHLLNSIALYGGELDFYSAPLLMLKAVLYPLLADQAGSVAASVLTLAWLGLLALLCVRSVGSPRWIGPAIAIAVLGYALCSPMQHPWNWVGALLVAPLLQNAKWVYWISAMSLLTYMRYVGVESLYIGAIVIGWGGAALLAWQGRTPS